MLHFSQLLETEKDLISWNLKHGISYKPLAKTYGFIQSLVALIWWRSSMHWTFSICLQRADFLAKKCEFKDLKWPLLCVFSATLNNCSYGTIPAGVSVRSVLISPLIFAPNVRCCISASWSNIPLFLSSAACFLTKSVDPSSLVLMDGIPYWLE